MSLRWLPRSDVCSAAGKRLRIRSRALVECASARIETSVLLLARDKLEDFAVVPSSIVPTVRGVGTVAGTSQTVDLKSLVFELW